MKWLIAMTCCLVILAFALYSWEEDKVFIPDLFDYRGMVEMDELYGRWCRSETAGGQSESFSLIGQEHVHSNDLQQLVNFGKVYHYNTNFFSTALPEGSWWYVCDRSSMKNLMDLVKCRYVVYLASPESHCSFYIGGNSNTNVFLWRWNSHPWGQTVPEDVEIWHKVFDHDKE